MRFLHEALIIDADYPRSVDPAHPQGIRVIRKLLEQASYP
jgi:hypothetical protein